MIEIGDVEHDAKGSTLGIANGSQHMKEICRIRCKLHNLATRQIVEVTYALKLEDFKMVGHFLHRIENISG